MTRKWLSLCMLALVGLIWVNVVAAFTASNTVPNSLVGSTAVPASPNQFLPPECLGRVSVSNIIVANPGGTTNAGGASSLILGSNLNDTINGQGGTDCIVGGGGGDTLNGGSGAGGADVLIGGAGNDNLNGGGGNDYIYGGDGNDTLSGGNGNDFLSGGNGTDSCDGGNGAGDSTDGTCETTNRIP